MTKSDADIAATKRLMGALLRMPPKPHSEMKIGKLRGKPAQSPAKKKQVRRGATGRTRA
jgi:hypothetical protein